MKTKYKPYNQKKLLKEFDQAVNLVKDVFVAQFGSELADKMLDEARREYIELIPGIPYVGGTQPFTQFVISTAWFLAMHRVMERHGRPIEETGRLIYQMSATYLKRYPRFLARLFSRVTFSARNMERRRKLAAISHLRPFPDGYVFNVIEGDGAHYDFGVDYIECATCKYLTKHNAMQIAPYICAVDDIYSRTLGWGLTRTKTLANGDEVCDFRFKHGGETHIILPEALRSD